MTRGHAAPRPRSALRFAVATAMLTGALATAGVAAADATDDYPIPHRILRTPCTAEQIMAAARDVEPVYFQRYMIDYHNKPAADQQGAQDSIHRFFAMDYAGRRQYAEDTATNAFFELMSWRWPNWAKLFFNNKGVAARTTESCLNYPADDMSIWDWR